MRGLDDLIRYELESTAVDFKAVQYARERFADLLKDVLAMANADVEGDRFIILGVKLHPDGSREVRGIPRDAFKDPAEFQQLVAQNIEPDLSVDYIPVNVDRSLIGVLRIYNCDEPPYLMRKQYGDLQQGDGFVRKGTHQLRLTRRDYERFLEQGTEKDDLAHQIRVSFSDAEEQTAIALPPVSEFEPPSERAAKRIRDILAERQRLEGLGGAFGWRVSQNLAGLMSGTASYEQRDTKRLQEDLREVKETYRDDDLHYLYEEIAQHLQLFVYNAGSRYVEDASLMMHFPKIDGLAVAKRIHRRPPSRGPYGIVQPDFDFAIGLAYPTVVEKESEIEVTAHIGDIRHGLWDPVFEKELRVVFGRVLEGKTVAIPYEVHGKNLRRPAVGELSVRVANGEPGCL